MADTEVLIVGAGPVGLTAALELRRRGVGCRVVDRLTAPVSYAKAVGIQPRTLELWDAAGVLTRALDAATPVRGQIVFVNGQRVGRMCRSAFHRKGDVKSIFREGGVPEAIYGRYNIEETARRVSPGPS